MYVYNLNFKTFESKRERGFYPNIGMGIGIEFKFE
jgi:hypothetical protein